MQQGDDQRWRGRSQREATAVVPWARPTCLACLISGDTTSKNKVKGNACKPPVVERQRAGYVRVGAGAGGVSTTIPPAGAAPKAAMGWLP